MDLTKLVEADGEAGAGLESVDVSHLFGEQPNSTVFQFRDPSLPELFAIPQDMARMRKKFPEWPDALTQSLATLAFAHVAPAFPFPAGQFYLELANPEGKSAEKRRQNSQLLLYLMAEFKKRFPHLTDTEEALQEEKNG